MSGLSERLAKAEAAKAAGYAVRPMERSDARRVAQVHVEVWRTAYATLLPEDYLVSLDVDEFAARWASRLVSRSSRTSRLVGLRSDGSIVALGSAGPSRDPVEPAERELYGLNVLAEERGTGLADLMMQRLVGDERCSRGCFRATPGPSRFIRLTASRWMSTPRSIRRLGQRNSVCSATQRTDMPRW